MSADHKENLEQTVFPALAMSIVLCIKLDIAQTVSLVCINEELKKGGYTNRGATSQTVYVSLDAS